MYDRYPILSLDNRLSFYKDIYRFLYRSIGDSIFISTHLTRIKNIDCGDIWMEIHATFYKVAPCATRSSRISLFLSIVICIPGRAGEPHGDNIPVSSTPISCDA